MKKPGYKTKWDLENLFYKKGLQDPQIDLDINIIEKDCESFEKKYSKKDSYLVNDKELLIALDNYEKLISTLGGARPLFYLQLFLSIDSQNSIAQAKMNLLTDKVTKSWNKTIFFELKLGKIDLKNQKKFLASKVLNKYHYFLDRLFLNAKYQLTEPEEKILNIKQAPSRSLWMDYSEKLLNDQTVNWKGKSIPLSEASNLISNLPKKDRHALHEIFTKKLKEISFFAEAEMTSIVIDKKTSDELRGFKKPYEARVLSTQNSAESVENIIKIVTEQFSISQRFYKLKAKLLGEKKLAYADRAVGIEKINKKLSFDESIEMLVKSLEKTDSVFVDIFQGFLKKGQVDVYPKKGKSSGAFCISTINQPTFVMLNDTEDTKSYLILAHEMGHAFHSELSKKQTPVYQDYTLSVAETASTFFENIAAETISQKLSEREQVAFKFQRLQDDIATIFRQVACFNFESDIHKEVREKGAITKERLAELHNKNMGAYLGPIVKLNEDDGYFFVQWSHIRNFFYVFTYAYGQIISRALYARYKKDPTFIKSIMQFLSAGGSQSPDDIFKSIGIDTTKPEFFLEGLKGIEAEILELEKTAKKLKMI